MPLNPPFALSLSKGFMKWCSLFATSALCGRAGPVTFLLRQKGNPKRRPRGFTDFLRCSRQAGVAQLVSAASLNSLRKLAYTEASPLRGYVFAR